MSARLEETQILESEMLQILQEFDENIISINSVKVNEFSESSEYMVLTRNHKRTLPLKVYGDGMKKAIVLLSAVLEAIDKVLRCKENLQSDINVYTLYKQNDKNLVRAMNC